MSRGGVRHALFCPQMAQMSADLLEWRQGGVGEEKYGRGGFECWNNLIYADLAGEMTVF